MGLVGLFSWKECNGVGFQPRRIIGSKYFNKVGHSRKLITRDGMGDDEYSIMRAMVIKELSRESDKIISIAGY